MMPALLATAARIRAIDLTRENALWSEFSPGQGGTATDGTREEMTCPAPRGTGRFWVVSGSSSDAWGLAASRYVPYVIPSPLRRVPRWRNRAIGPAPLSSVFVMRLTGAANRRGHLVRAERT